MTFMKIAARLEDVEADWIEAVGIVPEILQYGSLDDFIWARTIVTSRNFALKINGVKADALCPYGDLLNHRRPRSLVKLIDYALLAEC